MRKVFLGIDGGGTRTTAIAADESGRVLAKAVGNSINYYSMGMERARNHLREVVEAIGNSGGITSYEAVYIGNSALDDEATPSDTEALAGGLVSSRRLWMHSDAYIGLVALTLGKPGVLVISGTGSMGIGKGLEEEIVTVGGWGYRLGDQGSAYDIAMKGVQAGVAGGDGLGEDTMLTKAVARYFGVKKLKDLIPLFYGPSMERHVVAGFATEVANCAHHGDPAAASILTTAVRDLVRHALVLAERIGIPNLEIGAYGGVFQHNAGLFEGFKLELLRKLPSVNVSLLQYPPEMGAVFEGYRRSGIPVSESMRRTMRRTNEDAEVRYVNGSNELHP